MNVAMSHFVTCEKPDHHEIVEKLAEQAFGPGRFTRTAFRLREGVPHEPDLSFVSCLGEEIVASVRLTKIRIGDDPALLLGPLVVLPQYKSCGYGRELMETAVAAAREAGHLAIILVGDEPYYGKFGFEQVPPGQITLPGPVDPARLLICKLNLEDGKTLRGAARPRGET